MARIRIPKQQSTGSHHQDKREGFAQDEQAEAARSEAASISETLNQFDDVLNKAKAAGVISSTREAAQQFVEVDFEQTVGQ